MAVNIEHNDNHYKAKTIVITKHNSIHQPYFSLRLLACTSWHIPESVMPVTSYICALALDDIYHIYSHPELAVLWMKLTLGYFVVTLTLRPTPSSATMKQSIMQSTCSIITTELLPL